MTEELTKKLTDAGVLDEVSAEITTQVEAAEKSGYGKGYRAGKSGVTTTEKKAESKPSCFGSYKKTFESNAKGCRTCRFAKGCKK